MRQNLTTMFAKRHSAVNACLEKYLPAYPRTNVRGWRAPLPFGKPRERSVPTRGTKQEMKKTLLLIAAAALILNASGCGSCRNMFGSRSSACATPMMGHVQRSAPVCCQQPMCCPQPCDPCCSEGSAVNYGFDGSSSMMMGVPMGTSMGTSDCNCGQ
ncbi:hypothetical protein [Bythopirellula polymerisocia]|uniref:hypothetical protein n=1 Tax=Bythopirellula polymerisocia TaxID=2528003 RepID=UPI0011B3C2AB|nr:hypothetical protein [Bythopirellula polymerisocia]